MRCTRYARSMLLAILPLLLLRTTRAQLSDMQVTQLRTECLAYDPCATVVVHSTEPQFAYIARSVWPFPNTLSTDPPPANALYLTAAVAAALPRCGHGEQYVQDPHSPSGRGRCVIVTSAGMRTVELASTGATEAAIIIVIVLLAVLVVEQGIIVAVNATAAAAPPKRRSPPKQ